MQSHPLVGILALAGIATVTGLRWGLAETCATFPDVESSGGNPAYYHGLAVAELGE